MRANVSHLPVPLPKLLIAGILLPLLFCVSARADVMKLSLQSPLDVDAGTSGNSFDVLLTNVSGPAVSIAAFTFEILTTSTDVMLTGANTASVLAPYIFGVNSLFGPDITVTNTGTDLSASDLFSILGSDIILGTGQTIGLGHVSFDVSSSVPSEMVTITLSAFPATSLSDHQANNIPISTLTNGQVNIKAATVPEPSSMILLLTALVVVRRSLRS